LGFAIAEIFELVSEGCIGRRGSFGEVPGVLGFVGVREWSGGGGEGNVCGCVFKGVFSSFLSFVLSMSLFLSSSLLSFSGSASSFASKSASKKVRN
jgi:hypothetical protein